MSVNNKICRSCLKSCCDNNIINIFTATEYIMDKSVHKCLEEMCNISVSQDDNLPESLCSKCNSLLAQSYMFRVQTRKNDDFLHSILEGNLIDVSDTEGERDEHEKDCPNGDCMRLEEDIVQSEHFGSSSKIGKEPLEPYEIDCTDMVTPIEESSREGQFYENEVEDEQDYVLLSDGLYQCVYCKKTFYHKKNLNVHQKRHFSEGDFHCNICHRRFHTKFQQTRHLKVHTNLRSYQCQSCSKNFVTKPELNRHMKTHAASNSKDFMCPICKKEFATFTNVNYHIKTVHENERNFECNVCEKRFPSMSKVRRHQKSISCAPQKRVKTFQTDGQIVIEKQYIDEVPQQSAGSEPRNQPSNESVTGAIQDDYGGARTMSCEGDQYFTDEVLSGQEQIEISQVAEPMMQTGDSTNENVFFELINFM